MKVIQRDHRLSSYKLDNVVSEFIRDSIINSVYDSDNDTTILTVKSNFGIRPGKFISLFYNDKSTDNQVGHKFEILSLQR